MPFRTIELSDPRFERDGLRLITVKTPNLRGRGDMTLWLPDVVKQPLPLVILLHGVYGSHWVWALKGGAHHTADQLIREGRIRPMALVMPSDGLWGDGSCYLPHDGQAFDRWILDDVPQAVTEATEVSIEGLFISGLSMGGYGALRLGAMYPERFKAISGLSSITDLKQIKLFVEEPLVAYQQATSEDESVLSLMRLNRDRLPPIRFDCGRDDLLIDYNRELHQALLDDKIPHQYEEFDGGHEWTYWETHLVETLLFFNEVGSRTSE
ncbi:putative esterase [Fibrisoma limi BUZ 3]|uniref:Putative esterase n=1 Tax=Fibrisoma limi BUZ 3 TaxID=1185876 RepID=I2GE39_9BACT|nr:alpha/beta hydrolase-fold protein [Fibrisoma limi]CCH52164.1 putative esterase [Fibrisoma limi BUZ 3]